jgi:hypothetical protein
MFIGILVVIGLILIFSSIYFFRYYPQSPSGTLIYLVGGICTLLGIYNITKPKKHVLFVFIILIIIGYFLLVWYFSYL